MTYTEIDQKLKDEGFAARVRIALLRWCRARLVNQTRIANQDALAKVVLRGDRRNTETLTRALAIDPAVNVAIFADTAAGDTALDAAVAALVPAALSVSVLVVSDPDAVSP